MKGIVGFGVMAILLVCAVWTSRPATGQDRTEERISALETRIAVLAREVGIGETDDDPAATEQSSEDDLVISGSSDGSSSRQATLEAGQYRIEAEGTVDGSFGALLQVTVEGPGQFDYFLPFNETISQSGPYSETTELFLPDGGTATVTVTTLGFSDWTVTFVQIG